MKTNPKKLFLLLLVCLLVNPLITLSQTTVNSLNALLPYLNDNNANIKLAPGTYSISAADITAGNFSNPLFLFEGNNSTYDFTGVTINIDTEVLSSFGNVDVYEIQILGNNNVLKNLTRTDIGSNAPTKRSQSIVMDGSDNLLEGFHMTIRGSYPYGYGDAFGKGGGSIISHRKHSALLVRGESNHVKNCTLIHRSYGHAIFMQAASNPIIEGCYVEGEVRTTDDMLAEEGTGSPADNVDFMTVWGYKLPARFMMSTGEAGIRAYNAGTTYIDGVTIQRGTSNPTVLNCTIKNMRTGVHLEFATGTQHAEGTTIIGCESGFSLDNGDIVNCSADAAYGPVIAAVGGMTGNITILEPDNGYYNGSKSLASVTGGTLTLNHGNVNLPSDIEIRMGTHYSLRHQPGGTFLYQLTTNFSGATVNNYTNVSVELGTGASNNTINTCGTVTDNGSGNTVSPLSNCLNTSSFTPDPNKTYFIDNPKHNLRLASTGSSEDAYTASTTSNTGSNVQWKFVAKGNGSWHVQRAASGTKPRLRTDNTANADMQETTSSGIYTYFDMEATGYGNNTYFFTLPNGPNNYNRLQVDPSGNVNMVPSSYSGGWERFTITEAGSAKSSKVTKLNNIDTDFAIYPNPVTSTATIKGAKNSTINIYNMAGKVLLTKHISSDSEALDTSAFAKGMYLIKTSDLQQNQVTKIIKK